MGWWWCFSYILKMRDIIVKCRYSYPVEGRPGRGCEANREERTGLAGRGSFCSRRREREVGSRAERPAESAFVRLPQPWCVFKWLRQGSQRQITDRKQCAFGRGFG